MTATYENIATTTVGTATNTVTFSSISSSFTDLILVADLSRAASGLFAIDLQVNSDTATNYSYLYLQGDGSTASSARANNSNTIGVGYNGNAGKSQVIIHLFNYSNSTTNKTVISRSSAAQTSAQTYVGLWRSTSAINSVTLKTQNNMDSGSIITLYGIKAE